MGLRINQNIEAFNAYRNLSTTQGQMSKSLEKLSSGFRINRAADDAAGLAISEGLRSQVGGLKQASRNAQDGISVVQTAEGALTEVHSILQRMRDLGVQAANDSNNDEARNNITTEVTQLTAELDRIAGSTNFNGTNLLDGSKTSLSFQVGANGDANSRIDVNLSGANVKSIASDLSGGNLGATGTSFAIATTPGALTTGAATFTNTKDGVTTTVVTDTLDDSAGGAGFASVEEYASALRADSNFAQNFTVSVQKDANGAGTGIVVTANNGGVVGTADPDGAAAGFSAVGTAGTAVSGGLQFGTADLAQASINLIDEKISSVSTARSNLGAYQNRLEHTINNLAVSVENLSASESRIRDTDMATEMMQFTRSQILSQAGTAMLAQANQASQGVLSLLR